MVACTGSRLHVLPAHPVEPALLDPFDSMDQLFHDFDAFPFIRCPSQSLPSTCHAGTLAHSASVEIPIFFTTQDNYFIIIYSRRSFLS